MLKVKLHSKVTGNDSINKTLDRFGIGGTDLGIPIYDKGILYVIFGDTFSSVGKHEEGWRSNVIGISKLENLKEEGIRFERFITDKKDGYAKEIIPSKKKPNEDHDEVTSIPTGAIVVDGHMYIYYMSVRHWGAPGYWDVNFNRVMKSSQNKEKWEKVPQLIWDEEMAPNFAQIFPVEDKKDSNNIYLFGLRGGRQSYPRLARVSKNNIEIFDEYEYYIGKDKNNQAIFKKGETGLALLKDNQEAVLFHDQCAEISVMYNDYLKKWMAFYLSEKEKAIVYKTADEITGPWSNPQIIVSSEEIELLYGSFVHEVLSENNGEVIYMLISQWLPIYNVSLLEIAFK